MDVQTQAAPATQSQQSGTQGAPVTPNAAPPAVATTVPAAAPASAAPADPAGLPKGEPAAKAEPAKVDDTKGQFGAKITYNSTGNSQLDAALKFVGNLGLDLETLPGYAEAGNGDFSLLKAHLATLGVPGIEAYAELAELGFKGLQAADQAKSESIQALILEAEGGDGSQWSQALEFIRDQTQDAEGLQQREQLNRMLAEGGLATKLAADFILSQYRGQPNVSTPQRKSAVGENANGGAGQGNYALSAAEYSREVEALRRANPGQEIEGSDQLAQLRARRAAGRNQGR